jgi:hypothetical protein
MDNKHLVESLMSNMKLEVGKDRSYLVVNMGNNWLVECMISKRLVVDKDRN